MGPLIPLFWTSGYVCPGFQRQGISLICVLRHIWCDILSTLLQVQHGVRGIVLDRKNNRIEAAEISLSSGGQTVYSGQNGAFWKILRPGKYTISVTAPGFNTVKKVSGACTV